jgi:predicted metal-dependent peptidase
MDPDPGIPPVGPRPSSATRLLDDEERRLFATWRLLAADMAPYLSVALFAMQPLVEEGLGTFAVDARWRLYLDLAQGREWGPEASGAVLLHEVHHLLRSHHERQPPDPTRRNFVRWNLAGDMAINDDLLSAGIPIPSSVVPSTYDLPEGLAEERYYSLIPSGDVVDCRCGSGSGGPALPGELDEDVGGLDEIDAHIVRGEVRVEVRSMIRRGDQVPRGLVRWAEADRPPLVAWPGVLRRSLGRSVRRNLPTRRDTFQRPSRRSADEAIIEPGKLRRGCEVAVVVDTSASMDLEMLRRAASEAMSVLGGLRNTGVTLLSCDVVCASPVELHRSSTIGFTGGGGTDMRVGIIAASELVPRPDLIVVLTDGLTPWPATAPAPVRLLAVVLGDDGFLPYGRGIEAIRIPVGPS